MPAQLIYMKANILTPQAQSHHHHNQIHLRIQQLHVAAGMKEGNRIMKKVARANMCLVCLGSSDRMYRHTHCRCEYGSMHVHHCIRNISLYCTVYKVVMAFIAARCDKLCGKRPLIKVTDMSLQQHCMHKLLCENRAVLFFLPRVKYLEYFCAVTCKWQPNTTVFVKKAILNKNEVPNNDAFI